MNLWSKVDDEGRKTVQLTRDMTVRNEVIFTFEEQMMKTLEMYDEARGKVLDLDIPDVFNPRAGESPMIEQFSIQDALSYLERNYHKDIEIGKETFYKILQGRIEALIASGRLHL